MSEVLTCPKCGALIVPQLAKCRQCGTYLHGTALEGRLIDLLPERLAHSPGTAVAVLSILFSYLVMVALAGPANVIGFSSFTLRQLGGLHGPALLEGQYWRFVTYMLGHHDLVHLAFNVAALMSVGPVVEELFDRKKMFLTYMTSGVLAGVGSLVYYVYLRGGDQLLFVSCGASGAVSGMIGAALIGARRLGFDGRALAQRMTQWALYMVVWGFLMPGINNAAHLSGFLAGVAMARVLPLGDAATRRAQLAFSVASMATLGLTLVCAGFMIGNLLGYPVQLERDVQPRRILGMTFYPGAPVEGSDQERIWDRCINRALVEPPPEDPLYACELNARVNPQGAKSFTALAELVEAKGDSARAARLRDIARRIE